MTPFEYPSFRNYMTARALVTVASEMQAVAVGWQIYSITHKALDLGLVGLAQFLPGVLLFLLAGHTADRFPRRHILQCCYLGFACISALLLMFTVQGLHSVWPVYAVLLGNGVVRAFNGPASQAFLPLVVPEDVFPKAVAWGSSVFQGSQILGPMIGGAVYGIADSPAPVYAGAMACALGALFFMTVLRTEGRVKRPVPSGVIEGLRYLWRNKIVLGAISLDMFAVLLGGAVALLPVFAHDILHVGATGLGVLRGAPGAGAVIMALVLAYRPLGRHAGAIMLSCVAGFGVFTVAFGLSRSLALSVVALMLVGACDMVSVIVRHTLVQVATPDEMRGRVSAVNSVFIGASNEVGQFESGVTAAWLGAIPAVVLGGIGTIVVVALWASLFPDLRRVDQLQLNSRK
ncbi:MAG TPA: MFS transporter [Candidatus Acidoferrum sp.]|nr:MFS transporter [Candidatus Acidoferrum sp.]